MKIADLVSDIVSSFAVEESIDNEVQKPERAKIERTKKLLTVKNKQDAIDEDGISNLLNKISKYK